MTSDATGLALLCCSFVQLFTLWITCGAVLHLCITLWITCGAVLHLCITLWITCGAVLQHCTSYSHCESVALLCCVDMHYSHDAVVAVYRTLTCYKPDITKLTDGNELEIAKVCSSLLCYYLLVSLYMIFHFNEHWRSTYRQIQIKTRLFQTSFNDDRSWLCQLLLLLWLQTCDMWHCCLYSDPAAFCDSCLSVCVYACLSATLISACIIIIIVMNLL